MKAREVDTAEFQFSHGKKPSGRGRWIFEFRAGVRFGGWTSPSDMPYSVAKREALKAANANGFNRVSVGP